MGECVQNTEYKPTTLSEFHRFAVVHQKSKPNRRPEKYKIQLENRILFEDDDLMVINKPSGLPVHGGSGVNAGLIELFRAIRPDAKFLELVHRLDRGTSGCLLLAKKRSCLLKLHELFRSNQVQKYYTALVCGRWQPKKLLIDANRSKKISNKVANASLRSVPAVRWPRLYSDGCNGINLLQ